MTQQAALASSLERLKPMVSLALSMAVQSGTDGPKARQAEALAEMAVKASVELAGVCVKLKRIEEARGLLDAIADLALASGRDPGAFLAVRADWAEAAGDRAEAARCLSAIVESGGASADLMVRLGRHLLAIGQPQAARDAFVAALDRDPVCYDALCEMTHFALLQGNFTAARQMIDRALALRPDGNLALIYRAQIAIGEGEAERALAALDRVLAINPVNIDAHVLSARLKTYSGDDPALLAMEQIWSGPIADPRQRARLGFALFKALDDAGLPDRAFDVLSEANRLKYEDIAGSRPGSEIALMAQMQTLFSPSVVDALPRRPARRPHEPRLSFILGLPRSGTSLAEQILSCHPQVHGGGELDLAGRLVARHALEADGLTLKPAAMALNAETLEAMAEAYRAGLPGLPTGKTVFIDKMPINTVHIGFILAMFPDAAIIRMNRAPLANAFALYASNFEGRGMAWAYDLDRLAATMRAEAELMAHWRQVFGPRILDVSYEALTEAPEREIGRMLSHLGLDSDPRCLSFHESRRPVLTMSATQVTKPLYSGRDRRTGRYSRQLAGLAAALGIPAGEVTT